MKVVFMITLLSVWLFSHWYVYHRVSVSFGIGGAARIVLAVLLALAAVGWPLSHWLERAFDSPVVRIAGDAASLWMGFIAVLLLVLVIAELVIVGGTALGVHARLLARGLMPGAWSVSLVVSIVTALILSTVGWFIARGPVRIVDVAVQVRDLPVAMDGRTILFVSDIHSGGMVGPRDLDRIETAVRAAHGDILIFGGDLTDQADGGDGTAFMRFASWGTPGRVFAVSGNHERYSGGEKVLDLLAEAGVRVLRQEVACLDGGLCIAGVDDPALLGPGSRTDAELVRTLSGVPRGLPVVLVSHQPINARLAAANGADLMLSGHTHHGQLPPATIFTRFFYPYWAGRYDVDGMVLYVSAGAGFWGPPLRLGNRPEVVRVTLHPRASD